MTTKLIQILSDLYSLMGDWNNRKVPTEECFLQELEPLTRRLYKEIKKSELPVIEEDDPKIVPQDRNS